MQCIVRQLFDYFQEHPNDQKKIEEFANACANKVEERFIQENCSEFDLPLMDFEINVPELDF